MARIAPYKQYTRNQRRAVFETDFSHGMMSTDGLVDEGYVKSLVNFTYEKDNGALIPRPGIRPHQIIFPDMNYTINEGSPLLADNLAIKDVKECVENGITYYQIVLGKIDDEGNEGDLIVVTSERSTSFSTVEFDDGHSYDVRYAGSVYSNLARAYFYSSEIPTIHNVLLESDPARRTEFPVGSFAFGNSYYFFGEETEDQQTLGESKLFRTVFDTSVTPPRYKFEAVIPKEPSVSEAVTYGYNMLLGDRAYSFSNEHNVANVVQFNGILPYEVEVLNGQHQYNKLLMTPKKNQPIDLVCYYDIGIGETYEIVWESREVTSSDWTELQRDTITFAANTTLTLDNFHAQDKEIMMRVTAYDPNTDEVMKAMVVGFDFSIEDYGAASSMAQENYDLSTATGMEAWNGRIVLWGLPKDPTILFISDYNEPSYFPYPNNIVVFDEPIIYAVEFMDTLAVFTTTKLYQVTRNDDGNSWTSKVIQSHLSINPWDKHLVQTVRNMLYFKSGNYYYMMVPKAQSLTGELTLAPITTPITSFFDNFSVNVENILRETYDFDGALELITYYNFLDYEDIHNIYLYKFDDSEALLHFDVIYNTVDRTWKVWVYESAKILFPFKHNATETGLLANTSLIDVRDSREDATENIRRIIQVFTWDKLSVRGCYVPNGHSVIYDPNESSTSVVGQRVTVPSDTAYINANGAVVFYDEYADAEDTTVYLYGAEAYYEGFQINTIGDVIKIVYDNPDDYFTFRNFQFLDSGYRDDEAQAKKRYRELQLHINNLDKTNIQFGMEFILDGAPRKIFYKYDVAQTIDEFDPEYGILYIESTPFLETDLSDIDITNQWTIDQSLTPDISLWKVRIAISGKGAAPRLKLLSRNDKRFELLSINWVSRMMNMR